MSRKIQAATAVNKQAESTEFTYGELLRKALAWAIKGRR
jgi:hypothetical protein